MKQLEELEKQEWELEREQESILEEEGLLEAERKELLWLKETQEPKEMRFEDYLNKL